MFRYEREVVWSKISPEKEPPLQHGLLFPCGASAVPVLLLATNGLQALVKRPVQGVVHPLSG
jgi:hypothetical protein